MVSFEGEKCPVCHAILFEDDDVVVCPQCGTPHHRSCWSHLGHCANAEKHGTNWRYARQSPHENTKETGKQNYQQAGSGKRCPNCGAMSSSVTIFCPFCGYQFGTAQYHSGQAGNGPGSAPFDYMGRIIDPMGGVDPRTEIDGVSASSLMPFIAVNTQRYIPKFASMSQKRKKVSWNWASFFLHGYWLLYRKCYKEGILALIVSLTSVLLNIPMNLVTNGILQSLPENSTNAMLYSAIAENLSSYTPGVIICTLLSFAFSLGLMVIMGMFGDNIYKHYCVDKIKKIRETQDIEQQHEMNAKKGGVNFIVPVIAYFAFNMLTTIITIIII